MSDYQGFRITRHVIDMLVERGFATGEEAARQRVEGILAHPGMDYAARDGRATESTPQRRLHDADDSGLVLVVDLERRSVPTAYVSGHKK
jgi:hypothetical protein